MDQIAETISALQAEADAYSSSVRLWMNIMMIAFASSIIFVPFRRGARWILFAMLINILGLILIKSIFPEMSRTEIGAIIHLLFWPAALFLAWKASLPSPTQTGRSFFQSMYLTWLGVVSLVITVSILFDARTVLGMFG